MIDVQNLLSQGKTRAALNRLTELVKADCKVAKSNILILLGRFSRLEDSRNKRIIHENDANIEENKIMDSILKFIETYQMDNSNFDKTIQELIEERHQANKQLK